MAINRLFALGLLVLSVAGCANHDWMIRKEPVQSTIGNDPNKRRPENRYPRREWVWTWVNERQNRQARS